MILSRQPKVQVVKKLAKKKMDNRVVSVQKVLINKNFVANNNGFLVCQCYDGIQDITFIDFKCSNVLVMNNNYPQETLSVTLKSSEILVNTFARMVRKLSELKVIKFMNSKIMPDPCWDRKIELKKIESITIINSAIPLNMFETRDIKKFTFIEPISKISPTVMTLMACKVAEQKAMADLRLDISPKLDFLEYLSDITPKLSCLKKLMVKVTGEWNIKPLKEMLENNQLSLKYVGVTVVEDNTSSLAIEDAISAVLACQSIQVIIFCVKHFRGMHTWEISRESCKVNVLSLQSNDEMILETILRKTFICKLTLEIKLKNFNRNKKIENKIKNICNLYKLDIIIEDKADLYYDFFITKNWYLLESLKFAAGTVKYFPFSFEVLNSLKDNCKNLKFFAITLEHKEINVEWVIRALEISSLKSLSIVSSYLNIGELRIHGVQTRSKLIINDLCF